MRALAAPLCLALAACTGVATESEDDPAQDALVHIRTRWDTFAKRNAEIERILPPLAAEFETRDPDRWAAARDKLLARADLLDVGSLQLADVCDRGTRGDRARANLVFMGKAHALAAGFRSPDPAEWTRARRGLAALGPRGIDAAAVALVFLCHPADVPGPVLVRVQQELVALGPEALRVLEVALERANWVVCERLLPVCDAFRERGVAVLVRLLDHPDPEVQALAIRALARVSHPSAYPAVVRFAGPDRPWGIRSAALLALAATRDPRAREPILAALTDPDASVVRFAAEATGRLFAGTPDVPAVRGLLKVLQRTDDGSDGARDAARDALRAVTGLRRGGRADFEAWLATRGAQGS